MEEDKICLSMTEASIISSLHLNLLGFDCPSKVKLVTVIFIHEREVKLGAHIGIICVNI